MDYRELLRAYMDLVHTSEGTFFLSNIDDIGLALTPEQREELHRIAAQVADADRVWRAALEKRRRE